VFWLISQYFLCFNVAALSDVHRGVPKQRDDRPSTRYGVPQQQQQRQLGTSAGVAGRTDDVLHVGLRQLRLDRVRGKRRENSKRRRRRTRGQTDTGQGPGSQHEGVFVRGAAQPKGLPDLTRADKNGRTRIPTLYFYNSFKNTQIVARNTTAIILYCIIIVLHHFDTGGRRVSYVGSVNRLTFALLIFLRSLYTDIRPIHGSKCTSSSLSANRSRNTLYLCPLTMLSISTIVCLDFTFFSSTFVRNIVLRLSDITLYRP